MALVMSSINDDTLEDALSYVTDSLLLGQHKTALEALDRYRSRDDMSPEEAVLVSRAAARINVARGYPRAAKDALEWTTSTYSSRLTPDLQLELDFHLAFCSIVGCGELRNEYPAIAKVDNWLESVAFEAYDSRMIEFRIFLDKIRLVKQTLNETRSNDVRPDIAKRTRALVKLAEERKQHLELWKLCVVYCTVAADQEVLEWVEALVIREWVPDSVRAQFQLEAARKLLNVGRVQEADGLLGAAALSFARCQHAYGQADIRKLRLQHGLESCANPLKELVDIVADHCKADFPYGVLSSAPAPLALAFAQSRLDVYVSLQECFHVICEEVGITHERLLLDIQLLAAMNATTGYFATVVRLGQDLYNECNRLGYWTMSWLVGRVLSLAHHSRRQHSDALRYAEEVLAICREYELKASSEAAYHLAFIKGDQRSGLTAQRRLHTQAIIDELSATIEEDLQTRETKLACDKLQLILSFQYEQARFSVEDYTELSEAASATSTKIETLSQTLPVPENVQVAGVCKEHRITQLLFESKRSGEQLKVLQAIELCTGLIEAYSGAGLQLHTAMKYQFRSACHTQLYQMEQDFRARLNHLVAAEADLEKASQAFLAISSLQQVLVARHGQARIHVAAWETINTPVEDVLQNLSVLESVADKLRRELSAFGSLNALTQKQSFSGIIELQDLYRWATAITVLSNRPSDLFVWSQKRKARSLSEMLGLGIIIPSIVQQADGDNGDVQELFEQLRTLTAALTASRANEQVYLRQRIEAIEMQLRSLPQQAVRDFLTLRDGDMQTMKEVSELTTSVPARAAVRKTFFADYIAYGNDMYVTILDVAQPVETCCLQKLTITKGEVQDWVQRYFAAEDTRKITLRRDTNDDLSSPMRALDALIAPLKSCSEEGDLWLLSVTSTIATLPLHALSVKDGENDDYIPFIQRNPVVYIPSLPIGRVCMKRWQNPAPQKGRAVFVGNYDKPGEAERIYAQINRLAQKKGSESLCGGYATKDAYTRSVAGATLIHHHLHCRFSADNILKQALVLADHPGKSIDADDNAISIEPHGGQEQSASSKAWQALKSVKEDAESEMLLSSSTDVNTSTHLTVEEIFNLQLSSPLVVLVACESSSQTFAEGDEPLGLVTGFLCAGAASVIGASWPIPSVAGRKFSDTFYDQLDSSIDIGFVDLAVALQEAVLTIKDDENMTETYYWGGFCLYGSWLFRPPWLTKPGKDQENA